LLLPRLTKRVPSALVAIGVGTLIEWCIAHPLGTNTPLVGDIAKLEGSFPKNPWLSGEYTMPPFSAATFSRILPLSITMAAVGLLESMMTLNLIDDLTETKGSPRRECLGQGIANIICGLFGGMGGCAMIGQSMINVGSGARSRLSSATAGLVLLFIVLAGYQLINIIPVSALVGVMFNVVYHTFEWRSLKLIFLSAMPQQARETVVSSNQKIRRADALVIVVVTVVTLFSDLARGVACGMVVACGTFVWDTATLLSVISREATDPQTGMVTKFYEVHGVLFFGSTTKFLTLFDEKNDPDNVFISFESGHVADYSAIEALNKLGERYGAHGKTVKLQQLKPTSERIVRKSAGLLVKEMSLHVEEEEVLPTQREHLNVERIELHQDYMEHVQSERGSPVAGEDDSQRP